MSHAHGTMTITANGQLLLCAQDYNGDWNIGNILDSDTLRLKFYGTIHIKIRKRKNY